MPVSTPNEPDNKQSTPDGTGPKGAAAGPSKNAPKGGLVPPWQRGPGPSGGPKPAPGANGNAASARPQGGGLGPGSAPKPGPQPPKPPVPPTQPVPAKPMANSSSAPVGDAQAVAGSKDRPTPANGVQQGNGIPAGNGAQPGTAPKPGNGVQSTPAGVNGTANGRPGPPPRGVVSSGTAAASMGGQQAPVGTPERSGGGMATATEAPAKFVESPTRTISRDNIPTTSLPNLDAIHHVDDTKPVQLPPSAPRSAPVQVGATQPLRAAVQIRRIDPWATFKITAVLAVAGFFIWMISVAVLYLILDGMGVWDQVNSSFGTLVTADGSSSGGDIIGAGTVFGYAILLGAINAILLTALATVGAYIYNLCADLIGGAEITLADLD